MSCFQVDIIIYLLISLEVGSSVPKFSVRILCRQVCPLRFGDITTPCHRQGKRFVCTSVRPSKGGGENSGTEPSGPKSSTQGRGGGRRDRDEALARWRCSRARAGIPRERRH